MTSTKQPRDVSSVNHDDASDHLERAVEHPIIRFSSVAEKRAFLQSIGKLPPPSDTFEDGVTPAEEEDIELKTFKSQINTHLSNLEDSLPPEEFTTSIRVAVLQRVRDVLNLHTIKLWDWMCLICDDYFATTPIDKPFYQKGLTTFNPFSKGVTSLQGEFTDCLCRLTSEIIFVPQERSLFKTIEGQPGMPSNEIYWNGNLFLDEKRNFHEVLFNMEFSVSWLFKLFYGNCRSEIFSLNGVKEFLQNSEYEIESRLLDTYWDQITVYLETESQPPQKQNNRTDIQGILAILIQWLNSQRKDLSHIPALPSFAFKQRVLLYRNFKPLLCSPLPLQMCEEAMPEIALTQKLLCVQQWLNLRRASAEEISKHSNIIRRIQREHPDTSTLSPEDKVAFDASVEFLNTHLCKQSLFNIVNPKTQNEWKAFSNYVFNERDKKKRQRYGCIVDPKFRLAEYTS